MGIPNRIIREQGKKTIWSGTKYIAKQNQKPSIKKDRMTTKEETKLSGSCDEARSEASVGNGLLVM